jgi:hypothetical protein
MRRSVFSTINSMMKYSNGEDTTTLQILYLKLFRLFGMYLSRGLAPIVKSMQDFCNTAKQKQTLSTFISHNITKANRERLRIACLCNFTSALTHRLHTLVMLSDLIFVDFAVLQFSLALLLEGDDNQGNEDVDEEEREHYEVNHVEYGHFDAKVLNWTLVFVRRCH